MKNSNLHSSFILVALLTLASCSGSFLGGSSSGGRVTAGNSTFFEPAVESSAMDMDNIYNINFINNLVIQDLCGGDANACDPAVADVIALLESYDLDVPESILNGEFELPASGSAMVSGLSVSRPALRQVADYCAEAYTGIQVTVSGTPMSLASYMSTYKIMENGSKLKICEILNLRDEIKKEVKLNTAARYGYLMTEDQINETLRLRARREFLYVFVNSILAFGTDFIGLLQYLGLEVDSDVAAVFASSVNSINAGINKNKYQIRQVDDVNGDTTIETKEFFNENKGNTYLFVEQFISQGTVISQEPAVVHYAIDTHNFCKFAVGAENSGDLTDPAVVSQHEANLSECVTAADQYFQRVKFVHKASGDKFVRVEYHESPYTAAPVTVVNLKYSIDHRSLLEIVLDDWKTAVVALMQSEVDNRPDTAAQVGFTQEKINTLMAITINGSFGVGGAITDLAAGSPITDSDLPAKLYASVTEDIYVLIPQTVTDANVNLLLEGSGGGGASTTFNRSENGDVYFRLGTSEETVRIEHKRGQNLYQDFLGLNFLGLDFYFPPYQLTAADFFIFDVSLDQLNGDLKLAKPSALSSFEVKKDGTLRNFVTLSNLDFTFKTIDLTTPTSTSKNIMIDEAFGTPWSLQVKADVDSLTPELETLVYQQSQGNIGPQDIFDFTFTAPQGTYLKSTSTTATALWFAPQNGVIKPLNTSISATIAGVTKSVGPYALHEEGASLMAALTSITSDLLAEFPGFLQRQGGTFTGNVDCGTAGTKVASVILSRTYSSGSFQQSITDFSMNGTQYASSISVTGGYGPAVYNSWSYAGWDGISNYSGNYQADGHNIVQTMNVNATIPDAVDPVNNPPVSCSGTLTLN